MTPSDIEKRLADQEQRLVAVENEVKVLISTLTMIIDSHPAPESLLGWVQPTLAALRGRTFSSNQRALADRWLARLVEIEQKLLTRIAVLESKRQQAVAEKHQKQVVEEQLRHAAQRAREEDDDRSPGMGR